MLTWPRFYPKQTGRKLQGMGSQRPFLILYVFQSGDTEWLHGLNNSDFFRFLQVCHHINSFSFFFLQSKKTFENSLLKVLISAYKTDTGLKVISRLFRALQEIKFASSTYIKQKWERESNSGISEEVWKEYCEFQWRISSSVVWRVFGWKSVYRFFITPAQKSHHSGSASCWRELWLSGSQPLSNVLGLSKSKWLLV